MKIKLLSKLNEDEEHKVRTYLIHRNPNMFYLISIISLFFAMSSFYNVGLFWLFAIICFFCGMFMDKQNKDYIFNKYFKIVKKGK